MWRRGVALLICWSALAAGNYIYQVLTGWHHWDDALERSWFQFVALFAWWIMSPSVDRSWTAL